MKLYEVDSYQHYVKIFLENSPRGSVKRLGEALGCHPTFISQVISQRANFSSEQSIHFSIFAGLSAEETEYFTDLVARDRAGDQTTKEFYQRRLQRHESNRLELQERWKTKDALLPEYEYTYFENSHFQSIHCLIQIPAFQEVTALARGLNMPRDRVEVILSSLNKMGLAQKIGGRWHATQHSLHIGKGSPNTRRFHMNWRLKTAAILLEDQPEKNLHFSAVAAISKREAAAVRRSLVDVLDESRQKMVASKSEEVYVLNLDYYPLVPE